MIFVMTSKEMDLFLNNETDDSILEAQYVIVSNRIRRKDAHYDNILVANVLFPDPSVMCEVSDEDFIAGYMAQLSTNNTLLALIVMDAIVHDHNIIFICSKKEAKLSGYIYKIADYIYTEFGYPVYNYKDLATGKVDLISFDESKVYKKCKKIKDKAKYSNAIDKVKSDKKLKDSEKKHLKKLLKKEGLYKKGMSVSEMQNIVDVFFE